MMSTLNDPHWIRLNPDQKHLSAFAFSIHQALPDDPTFVSQLCGSSYFQLRFSLWIPPDVSLCTPLNDTRPRLSTIFQLGSVLSLCFDKRKSVSEFCLVYKGLGSSRLCVPLYGMRQYIQRIWFKNSTGELTLQSPPTFVLQVQGGQKSQIRETQMKSNTPDVYPYVVLYALQDSQQVVYNTLGNAFPLPIQPNLHSNDNHRYDSRNMFQVGPDLSTRSPSLPRIPSTDPNHEPPIRALITNISWVWSNGPNTNELYQNWQWSIQSIPESNYGKQQQTTRNNNNNNNNIIEIPPDLNASENDLRSSLHIIPSLWKSPAHTATTFDTATNIERPPSKRCTIKSNNHPLVQNSRIIMWTGLIIMAILVLYVARILYSLYATQAQLQKESLQYEKQQSPDST